MRRIVNEDFVFVTNNAKDFERHYAKTSLHAGLIIIVPQVPPSKQRDMFRALIDYLFDAIEPINEVIEIRLAGDRINFNRYKLPA